MFRPMLCSRKRFLSTPSARRATSHRLRWKTRSLFLSTPSARRATTLADLEQIAHRISIHALREEGDLVGSYHCETHDISIHALREEGDLQTQTAARLGDKFLSTPSARRATRCTRSCANPIANFYPRPPRGGRRRITEDNVPAKLFLSTPSARRATTSFLTERRMHDISIHALREEGDPAVRYHLSRRG